MIDKETETYTAELAIQRQYAEYEKNFSLLHDAEVYNILFAISMN